MGFSIDVAAGALITGGCLLLRNGPNFLDFLLFLKFCELGDGVGVFPFDGCSVAAEVVEFPSVVLKIPQHGVFVVCGNFLARCSWLHQGQDPGWA